MEHAPQTLSGQFVLLFGAKGAGESDLTAPPHVGTELTFLKKECLSSRLRQYPIWRSLAWSVLLGVLHVGDKPKEDDGDFVDAVLATGTESAFGGAQNGPPTVEWAKVHDGWRNGIDEWVEKYTKTKEAAYVDPRAEKKNEDVVDASNFNPLTDSATNPWTHYFANTEIQQEIQRDVIRTFPDIEFFHQPYIQEMMLRILFIWSKENAELGYKQGMHELLAPIVFMLIKARQALSPSTSLSAGLASSKPYELPPATSTPAAAWEVELSTLMKYFHEADHIEPLAYALFRQLLLRIADWYKPVVLPPQQQQVQQDPLSALAQELLKSNGPDATAPAGGPMGGSPSTRKARYIQEVLLKKFDPQLHTKLTTLGIEPTVYLLKWIRLLFGREFHLEDALLLWDAIFAYDPRLTLVEYISTAMLIFLRTQLLSMDYAMTIKRLLKYPPVEDIAIMIEQGIALTKPKASIAGFLTAPSQSSSPSPTVPHYVPSSDPVPRKTNQQPQKTLPASKPVQQEDKHLNRSSLPRSGPTPSIHASLPRSTSSAPTGPSLASSHPPTATKHSKDQHKDRKDGKHKAPQADSEEIVAQLQSRVDALESNQTLFAAKLQSIIDAMQREISKPEVTEAGLTDCLIMAVAELKRTKDMAFGYLPIIEEPSFMPTGASSPFPVSNPQANGNPAKPTPPPEPSTSNGSPKAIGSDHVAVVATIAAPMVSSAVASTTRALSSSPQGGGKLNEGMSLRDPLGVLDDIFN